MRYPLEPVGLVFKPQINQGNRSQSLIGLFLSQLRFSEQLSLVLGNERSVKHASFESLVEQSSLHEFYICWETHYFVVVKSLVKGFDCFLPIMAPDYKLGNHWIVESGYLISFSDACVDSDSAWNLLRFF